jgi:hypothetical protein
MIRLKKVIRFLVIVTVLVSCKKEGYIDGSAENEPYGPNGYVGASTCIECHKEEYDNWMGSHHELAMQVANDSTVLGDFNNVNTSIDGVQYFFFKEDNDFLVRIKEIDNSEKVYKITYTFGVIPLQQYLVDFEKGKKQVLRVTWDTEKLKWFHQYKGDTI